ncbi:MAG: hypothetical protein M3458_03190 [Acidobacteriota bacterium]|nr:hypothetical protein [Acidobacteriota bacterium]
MGSEDLDQSLRASVDEYLNGRLGGLQEEIARLQSQLNEALTRLSERLGSETQSDASVVVAISEHLRAARNEGIETAAHEHQRARASSDVAILKAAVDDIDNQRAQADILSALVNRTASFAPRVAFFVVKNNRVTGWRARGLEGTVGDDAVRELSLPLDSDTLLAAAVKSRATWSGAPGSHAEDHTVFSRFGGDNPPMRIVAIPLVARDRAVAVLYADCADMDADAINLEALETLVRVSGMAVELLATKRPAVKESTTAAAPAPSFSSPPAPGSAPPPEPPSVSQFVPPPPASPAATDIYASAEVASPVSDLHFSDVPTTEIPAGELPASDVQFGDVSATEIPDDTSFTGFEITTPHIETGFAEPELITPLVVDVPVMGNANSVISSNVESGTAAPGVELFGAVEAPPQTEAPAPMAVGNTAPLGSGPLSTSRRSGADAALPIEVREEEKRVHNDARRFARLLVSEIKLYNEHKVREGRVGGDLYNRLREDIDRSRQMYDKRVAPEVAGRYDYFHQELVNTLAEGDPSKLGEGYPGATVSA